MERKDQTEGSKGLDGRKEHGSLRRPPVRPLAWSVVSGQSEKGGGINN